MHRKRVHIMFPQRQRTYEELDALLRKAIWNKAFGCYTRNGFEDVVWPEIAEEARWIIYFDIDNIHDLNSMYGSYDPVDAMIHQALGTVRFTDYVAGQFKSGDEFLICLTERGPKSVIGDRRGKSNPQAMVDRLTMELGKVGLTATFAIVPVISPNLLENVQPAIEQVHAAKNSRPGGSRRKEV